MGAAHRQQVWTWSFFLANLLLIPLGYIGDDIIGELVSIGLIVPNGDPSVFDVIRHGIGHQAALISRARVGYRDSIKPDVMVWREDSSTAQRAVYGRSAVQRYMFDGDKAGRVRDGVKSHDTASAMDEWWPHNDRFSGLALHRCSRRGTRAGWNRLACGTMLRRIMEIFVVRPGTDRQRIAWREAGNFLIDCCTRLAHRKAFGTRVTILPACGIHEIFLSFAS